MPASTPPDAHQVKTEKHDTNAYIHYTNTGARPVSVYRETRHGLYVSRPFQAHPRIRHWQAHLLPALNLVVCQYDFHHHHEHDFYIDVARITQQDGVWAVRDLYLDVVLHEGQRAEIVDTHELLAGHRAGFISSEELHLAVDTAHRTLAELARQHYVFNNWTALHGIELDWGQPQEFLSGPTPVHA